MDFDISKPTAWVKINSRETFDKLQRLQSSRCKRGDYSGPGLYATFCYQERCPRNCCYDSVIEMLDAKTVISLVKEKMIELAEILKKARKV